MCVCVSIIVYSYLGFSIDLQVLDARTCTCHVLYTMLTVMYSRIRNTVEWPTMYKSNEQSDRGVKRREFYYF